MNSIRPLISYTELLAARQHLGIIRNELKQVKKSDNVEDLEEIKEYLTTLHKKVDECFLKQVSQIEFQIDINYPQL